METMHIPSTITDPSTGERKPFNRLEALQRENEWIMETADVGEFLASEEIPDNEYYKQYIPALKTKFKELFNFEPKVTNSFIIDLDDFLKYHKRLQENPSNEQSKDLAEVSRSDIREWLVGEIIRTTYKSETTPEYEAEVDRQVEEATNKIDELYAWIFQNIPAKPTKQEEVK